MHNRSAQEVYDIVTDSRSDPQVELIVSRPLTTINRKTVQESWRQSHSPTRVQAQQRCRGSLSSFSMISTFYYRKILNDNIKTTY